MIDPEAPVEAPAGFVGQAGLVRRVYSRIGAERPQSVAVIGGSRSGKTSLLCYLSNPQVAERHLKDSSAYTFFSYRAAREMTGGPEALLDAFSKRLSFAPLGASNRYDALRGKIEELHQAGRRLVVFLDDFHFITSNERFPLEFFSFLRSMANNYNLAYVTASLLELQKLCVAKEVQESPFFNIFTNMHLGMLSADDARTLFCQVDPGGDALAERVIGWCGGSPYILKIAGTMAAVGKIPEKAGVSELERILLPELSRYFGEVVSFLAPEAAKPLAALAKGRTPSPSEEHHVVPLIKQGFLVEGEGAIVPFSPAFAAFLRNDFSPRMLKGGC